MALYSQLSVILDILQSEEMARCVRFYLGYFHGCNLAGRWVYSTSQCPNGASRNSKRRLPETESITG